MNCDLCGTEIKESFLGKIKGTIVKVNKNDKNTLYKICNACQIKNKGKDLKKLVTEN